MALTCGHAKGMTTANRNPSSKQRCRAVQTGQSDSWVVSEMRWVATLRLAEIDVFTVSEICLHARLQGSFGS